MGKLDDDRWSTKMMLTQHVEALDERELPPAQIEAPTKEELRMIRDAILLPHMLTMAKRSVQDIERTGGILSRLYKAMAHALVTRISKDIYANRRALSRANIKIHNDETGDAVIYYNYTCRGCTDRVGLAREAMREMIAAKFGAYITELTGIIDKK